jgi:hypothetical protein
MEIKSDGSLQNSVKNMSVIEEGIEMSTQNPMSKEADAE